MSGSLPKGNPKLYQINDTLTHVIVASSSNNDWTRYDFTQANKAQKAYDNSSIFPTSLVEERKYHSLSSSYSNDDEGNDVEATYTKHISDMSNTNNSTQNEEYVLEDYTTNCKTEAKQRNPSFQQDKDDGDAPQFIIQQLKKEVTVGTSILSLLRSNENCDSSHVLDSNNSAVTV